jgi:ubiquinone/menaquinone biosynthesis C-methylase UbiE
MQWTESEVKKLSAVILEDIYNDLKPLNAKKILLLCSREGEIAFWLIEKERDFKGKIVGLELSEEHLRSSLRKTRELKLESVVEFHKAEKYRIPFPDGEFDALISEFIIFPTPTPTNIGVNEMARVLREGGKLLLTDVIAIREIPSHVINKLRSIGLNYFCYATFSDFKEWMINAGIRNVEIIDLTPILKRIWEERYYMSTALEHREAYHYLLDSDFSLGRSIFYIYVKGEK